VIVGNPPFLGGTRISTVLGMAHFSWLKHITPGAGHLCDLVAYFFRRSFSLLKEGGAFGLLATNTIAQGDTRAGGLTPIRHKDGAIFSATKRMVWPGRAVVRVSLVHVVKGPYDGSYTLNGQQTPVITAFLFDRGGDDSPVRLAGRNALFSAGSKIYGQGFLFDDEDPQASPVSLMAEILDKNPAADAKGRRTCRFTARR
jgi:hypothetical protein